MGNRIKELRKERGVTLKTLSDAVGIAVSTLSGYEKAEGEKDYRNPKIENWEKIADYFKVPVEYLEGKGVDVYAISKRLGHSDITITLKTYSYLIDEYKAQNDDLIVKKLQELI